MRENIMMVLSGILGATLSWMFGGFSTAFGVLIGCMAADYLCGLIVAGVFKNSPKSPSGALESRAGWKGLCRKGGTLAVVFLAAQLDKVVVGGSIVRDGVLIAYILNEAISITENIGLMGVPLPRPLVAAIDILKGKIESEDEK